MNSSTNEPGSSSLSMRSRAVSLPSVRWRAAAFGSASRAICSRSLSFLSRSARVCAMKILLSADDPHALQHRQHDRGGDHRADLSASIGAHGMHQKIVFLVVFLAFDLNDARRHGKSRDAGGADQRVDLAAGERAHDFAEEHADGGVEADGDESQAKDQQRFAAEKVAGFHGSADAESEQQ